MKEYYYKVYLPEKLSEITENNFCEVFEDLTGKYDGMWIKVVQTERWCNYSNDFIIYKGNWQINIEYKGWKLKPVRDYQNRLTYNFYSDWNYTRFGALIEDVWGNTKNLMDDYFFWEVYNSSKQERSPRRYITDLLQTFSRMVETYHDVVFYDLYLNSFEGRFNNLTITLSKYKSGTNLETGQEKIKWLENQCIRCLELSKKYIEEKFFPRESVSDIFKRYEDALKQTLELYSEEIGITKD